MRIRIVGLNRVRPLGIALALATPLYAWADDAPPAPDATAEVATGEQESRPRPVLDTIFRRWDVSQDGIVEVDEVPTERKLAFHRLVEEADQDSDKMLSRKEFDAGMDGFADKIMSRFRFASQKQESPPHDDHDRGDRPPRDGERRHEQEGRAERQRHDDRDDRGPRDRGPRGGRPEGRERGPGGPEGRPFEGGRPGPPLFGALDRDGDGSISSEEIDNATRSLKRLDRNQDGKLTRHEIASPGMRGGPRPVSDRREHDDADRRGPEPRRDDGDRDERGPGGPREERRRGEPGKPGESRDEGRPFGPRGPGFGRGFGGGFGDAYRGGFGRGFGGTGRDAGPRPQDGRPGGREGQPLFDRLDSNDDGHIDRDELQQGMPAFRPRGRSDGPRPQGPPPGPRSGERPGGVEV